MTARSQSGLQQGHARMATTKSPYGMYSGKVIGVNPDKSTLDIKLNSGDTLRNAQILLNNANTITGWRYLTSVKNVVAKQTSRGIDDSALLGHEQDTIAIVSFLNGDFSLPIVVGFKLPLDSQMHLKEDGLYTFRHENGQYEVITKDNHHEIHYPDGSYVIISPESTPTPKDMSAIKGTNAQKWGAKTTGNMNLKIHLTQGVDITISNNTVKVNAQNIIFNNGTNGVARVGDAVSVSGTTSDGATFSATGTITGGSTTVKA